ncbi:MAG TPA: hypothetical protein VG345_07910 [Bryobacteraceae bacterium]|jgi:hypothetical protein|nr:hypothetical protein [Bryobacteraceae bacterium]
MKEAPRQQFRWAPHVSGAANAKQKDYEPSGEVEAESEYAAWASLRQSGRPLEIGDVLEILSADATPTGVLRICKYVGFEEARWFVPEPQPAAVASAPAPVPQPA